ncbi:hypothetical protein [Streptomyces sp. NPDC090445]|uniref:hypothetical protein n=1 Tax=Streptomyces sp. NPDC090445 TaxID=3365963 RepID=UPI00382EBD33
MEAIPLREIADLTTVLDGLAGNPALGDDLALRLLGDWGTASEIAWRESPGPSEALCEGFLARGRAEELAQARTLPPTVTALLAAHTDPAVRTALAKNPALSAELAGAMAADQDGRVRKAVAERTEAPPEDALRMLLTDPDPEVRAAACRHRPPGDLHGPLLADPATRRHVVPFLDLDPDTAADLAADPDEEVREALAAHPALSAALRDELARDADPFVRGAVFQRADTPEKLRDEIHAWLTAGAQRAGDDWSSGTVADTLCHLALIGVDEGSYPWVVADPLPHVDSPCVGLRRAAARSGALPPEVRARMLADEDASVRFLALTRLPDVDLAVAEDIDRRHRVRTKSGKGSAGRPADCVDFPPETLRRFATDPDARMRVLALRDSELPAELLERLGADEDPEVRRAAAAHPRLPPAALVRLLADPIDSVAGQAAASPALPEPVMRALLDHAEASGWPSPEWT